MSDETEAETGARSVLIPAEIEVRSSSKRELDMRLLPWDTQVETLQGPEEFTRGAFADTDPNRVLLMGPNHEARLGLDQNGQPTVTRVPIGKARSVDERDDGPHATFKVANTQAGDETLALAAEGIVTGVSIEFRELPGGTDFEKRNGRRTRVHKRVQLMAASITHRPAYGEQAAVLAVRSQSEGDAQMGEAQETAPVAATEAAAPPQITNVVDLDPLKQLLEKRFGAFEDSFRDRIERIETRAAQDIEIPGRVEKPGPHKGSWFQVVLNMMAGERVSERDLQTRELAELITSDNAGVVPPTYSQELIGIIDPSRPFLDSTRRLPTPDSGMALILPRIVTRPTVGIQAIEKDELTSTETSITSATFNAVTKGGAGDISLQLLRRSSPSYLSLYLELLAEAYAIDADDEAVDALLAETAVVEGGFLEPQNTDLGAAWANAMAVSRRLSPDRIWLSTAAVAAFIDAKASGTNAPLYSNLEANFTAGGGTGGTISGLRPVHVPALDDESVDIIVGPSRGFAWAEDGTFTLQVDVPAKAGRDVALVGILWFAPLYPAAFTSYQLGSA